jgi:DNA-binding transcriptional regulator YiaG
VEAQDGQTACRTARLWRGDYRETEQQALDKNGGMGRLEMTGHFYRPCDGQHKEPYHYRACGLDDIYLVSGYEIKEIDGERSININDMDGLHHAIALYLIEHKKTLKPKEIRFFRRQLGLTQVQLANIMGVTDQTVARWEKGQVTIPDGSDRMLRLLYLMSEMDDEEQRDLMGFLKQIAEMDESLDEPICFEETENGWAEAA